MVGFIYGRRGTGKSEFVYSRMEEAAKAGKVYLLVPDREAVMAESRVAELSGAEVLNETRKQVCIDGAEHTIPTIAVIVKSTDQTPALIADSMVVSYDMERFILNLDHGIQRAKMAK